MRQHVYITGHTGFIGSALMNAYGEEALPWNPELPPGRLIMHMASRVGVAANSSRSLADVWDEMEFHRQVFEFAARTKTPVIVASSSEVYASSPDPMKETDPLIIPVSNHPRWIYGRIKLFLEQAAFMFAAETGIPSIAVRLFNVCGPGQTADSGMVIPRFIQAALQQQPLEINGSGEQIRTFTHINDAVSALMSLPLDFFGQPFYIVNIGTDNKLTIRELAEKIIAETGSASSIIHKAESGAEIFTRIPDISRLKQLLPAWNPRSIESIIRDTVTWSTAEGWVVKKGKGR